MRSAEAAARGTKTKHERRHHHRHEDLHDVRRNAERFPIGIPPESMRSPPNHTIATVERFMIPKRKRIIIANRRLVLRGGVGGDHGSRRR